jgi:hypothetical protein
MGKLHILAYYIDILESNAQNFSNLHNAPYNRPQCDRLLADIDNLWLASNMRLLWIVSGAGGKKCWAVLFFTNGLNLNILVESLHLNACLFVASEPLKIIIESGRP